MRIFLLWVFVFVGSLSSAHAQPELCSDVLVDGSMKLTNLENSDYVKVAFAHRLYRMSESQAKQELSHTGEFEYFGYGFLSGDSDTFAQDFQTFKEVYEEELKFDLTRSQEISLLQQSGDATIVNAWLDCMKLREDLPLQAYYTKVSEQADGSLIANLVVRYTPPAGETTLGPRILNIDPDTLDFLNTTPEIRVNREMPTGFPVASFVKLPKLSEDDGEVVKYRDLFVNITAENTNTATAVLPGFRKKKINPPKPWLTAGEPVKVSKLLWCNPGTRLTNSSGCKYQAIAACSAMNLDWTGQLYPGHCINAGSSCSSGYQCKSETRTIDFVALYPCNPGAVENNPGSCKAKAKTACEALGLDFVNIDGSKGLADCPGSPNCDVDYTCRAKTDVN